MLLLVNAGVYILLKNLEAA